MGSPDSSEAGQPAVSVPDLAAPDSPTPDAPIPDLPTIVAFINAQHGTTFRISERYLNGEQGASALMNAESVRFVLKWTSGAQDFGRLPDISRLIGKLRNRWYPVPRYILRGLHPAGRYVIQAALPGAPVKRLSAAQTEQILALNERQRDLTPADAPPWPAQMADDVIVGGDGYCLLDAMSEHSPTSARLLDVVQALAARHRNVTTPTTDVVHFDFQPTNILAQPDRITGVVDWDGACAGDRAFDLATLLFYVYDQEPAHEALWGRLGEIADPAATVLYLAHLIHRQVDWSIRHHDAATVDRWLERSRAVLADLPARTGCAVRVRP
jgi:hypothetical protein